ncbi:MAG: SAM-dependent methyltransferase [Frankia sp.]
MALPHYGDDRRNDPLAWWAPRGVDVSVPHSARVYDWWLGGKDNFEADRALGELFIQTIPTIRDMARENRDFVGRAVRYLAAQSGVRQFLDIGTGIPTSPNLHEVAQQATPDARVVYVDNDPIVLTHARALLTSGNVGATEYVDADLREPEKILNHPGVMGTLDLRQPVGVTLIAVLMLLEDADDPAGLVHRLLDPLPSGSYVALTHPGRDFDPEAMAKLTDFARQGHITLVPRVKAQVAEFFGGWEMIEPGLVPVAAWRPDGPPPSDTNTAFYWSGVARKP